MIVPAFAEIRFPEDISYHSQGGPGYSTQVVVLASGHEQRLVNWSHVRHRYNVAYGIRSFEDLQTVVRFFHAMRGQATAFRYRDWLDYQATLEAFGTGDGAATAFQLQKTYSPAVAASYVRPIRKPVGSTVRVYANAVEQVGNWSVDATTGLVTFTTAPAVGVALTWSGDFDVPVRFASDTLPVTLDFWKGASAEQIELIEIRV